MLDGRNVIFEFTQIGTYTKVTAMDTDTLTEISIQGPSTTPEKILKNNALRRLKYVLQKKGVISE